MATYSAVHVQSKAYRSVVTVGNDVFGKLNRVTYVGKLVLSPSNSGGASASPVKFYWG